MAKVVLALVTLAICYVGVHSHCNGDFFLKNRGSGRCIDVEGNPGTENFDNIQSWACEFHNSHTDQIWFMDDYERIVNRRSGKCLDVLGDRSPNNHQNIILYECEDPLSQATDHVWNLDYLPGTDFFQIKNVNTGKCVDVVGWSDADIGTNVEQYDCEDFCASEYGSPTDHWFSKVEVCD